jgi:NAD(P)-dependent dehydrogenase (short-subunit alcohol dehydrogenase family)
MTAAEHAGRVFLVTGAGAGIGRATALMAAEAGASVVCADVDIASAQACAQAAHERGAHAIAVACNVAQEDDAKRACTVAMDEFQGLHVLVNCAAIFAGKGPVTEIAVEDWRRGLDVNVTGVFLMCKHALPRIATSGGGVVVNIASVLAHVGAAGRTAYCAHKGALLAMTRSMAIDHAGDGVRVVSVSPGPVGTERYLRTFGGREEANRTRGGDALLKRIADPEEVAATVLFLASRKASYITGADLLVDGGICAV